MSKYIVFTFSENILFTEEIRVKRGTRAFKKRGVACVFRLSNNSMTSLTLTKRLYRKLTVEKE